MRPAFQEKAFELCRMSRRLSIGGRHARRPRGMTHLRSPAVHHLELNHGHYWSSRGKKKSKKRSLCSSIQCYSLFFNSHCDQLIQRLGLDELHIQTAQQSVKWMRWSALSYRMEILSSTAGCFGHGASENRSTGMGPGKRFTGTAYFRGRPRSRYARRRDCAVVGGGISACQVALRLAGEGRGSPVSRLCLREHQFDSDPGWLGLEVHGRLRARAGREPQARDDCSSTHKGSVPPDAERSESRSPKRKIHLRHFEELDTEGKSLELRLSTEDLSASTAYFSPRVSNASSRWAFGR